MSKVSVRVSDKSGRELDEGSARLVVRFYENRDQTFEADLTAQEVERIMTGIKFRQVATRGRRPKQAEETEE